MAELPTARVCHFATGRLRIKIPEKRHDDVFFARVAERVSDWDSVERVEVNPLTASVLVFFKDSLALFTENALKNDLFLVDFEELEAAQESSRTLTVPALWEQASRAVAGADNAIRRLSADTVDLRGGVFLALLAGGMAQLFRGNITAPAVTLLWYAGEMLRLKDRVTPGAPGKMAGED
jgi:Heavy metal associated domain 2